MNRDLLSRRLKQLGHEVEIAVNGREALAKIAATEFDVVLLDIMMPEVDGYKVLEELRGNGTLDRLPVIMISAVTEMDSVVRCVEMGATDYLPKPFNPVLLKARVGATLEKKRLRDAERLWAKSMERELEIGREIQTSFLPEELPSIVGFEIAARFTPARQVAGDFYDAFGLDSGRYFGIVVADVCDKGVGAALFMALFRSLLRAFAERAFAGAAGPAAEPLLSAVVSTNDYIARTHGRANMFATAFVGVLDPAAATVTWINAGHEAPVLFGSSGIVERLAPTGPALGMLPDRKFGVKESRLDRGQTLLAFTDGVTEAKSPSGAFYGEERLLALLAETTPSADALLERIERTVQEHTAGAERSDDITMLALRRAG
jgi:phosphoserine phosphatase RsbU/P